MTNHVDLDTLTLESGGHDSREDGMCIMEAVAWWAGEPHSASPECASPILTTFAMGLNDTWPDDQRQKLIPFIPRLVGTRDDLDQERGLLAADWLVRTFTPAWLRLAGLTDDADRLAVLDPITSWDDLEAAQPSLTAARESAAAAGDAARAAAGDAARAAARAAAWDAVWDAARAAARDAVWAAARDAAGDAAMAAAWAAARAAARDAAWAAAWAAARAAARDAVWAAARDAAGDAARAAAGDAARAAAGDALEPTVAELRVSALALFDWMITPTPRRIP